MLTGACNDPTTIGEGIVDTDVIPILFDEVEIELVQNESQPIVTYSDGTLNLLNQAQCGLLTDDQFGRSEANIYMQMIPTTVTVGDNPNRIVDSVCLVLYLDTISSYGPVAPVTLAVRRMENSVDGTQNYLSNQQFATGEVLNPGFTFIPDYTTPDTPVEVGPTVRIPFPISFATELFTLDSTQRASFQDFTDNFPGIEVYPVGDFNHYVGLRPYQSTIQTSRTGVRIYYRNAPTDTASLSYGVAPFIGDARTPVVQTYNYDYSGSAVEDALSNPDNDRYFIQGNGGVDVNMKIDGLTDFGSILVNKATMFVPFDENALDYNVTPALPVVMMTRRNLNGSREFINEFQQTGIFTFTPIGLLDTLNGQVGYEYNLPIQIQQMIDRTIFDDEIRLQSVFVSSNDQQRASVGPASLMQSSARSVIFDETNLSEAIRLIISYTEN